MAREDPQFRIRLPADLKAKIEASAAAEQRSLNAEIVARLRLTVLNNEAVPPGIVASMADDLQDIRVLLESITEQGLFEANGGEMMKNLARKAQTSAAAARVLQELQEPVSKPSKKRNE